MNDQHSKSTETVFDLVRMVFPNATEEEAEYLLWERTGYPCFFRCDPRTAILESLQAYKNLIDNGKKSCHFCNAEAVVGDHCKSCDDVLSSVTNDKV